MSLLKVFLVIVFTMIGLSAHADAPADPQRPQPPPIDQQYQYQQPAPAPGPGCCGTYDPRSNYWCEMGCPEPVLPYPPRVMVPIAPPPVVTPYFNNAPIYRPYPRPYVRPYVRPYGGNWGNHGGHWNRGHGGHWHRTSAAAGCEIQQGNSGEFVVLSFTGQVLFSDSSIHAQENAAAMKVYYEKSKLGLCANKADAAFDI